MTSRIPLLSAFEQAETEGVTVDEAINKRGRANTRRMMGWHAYGRACTEIETILQNDLQTRKPSITPLGWDLSLIENRAA